MSGSVEYGQQLTVLLVVCCAVHVVVALGGPLLMQPDSGGYTLMAEYLHRGSLGEMMMSVAYYERVPGYGIFLYLVQKLCGANSAIGLKLIQHLIGLSTNVLVYVCALLMTGRRRFAFWAGILSLLSLQVLAFQNYVMTETLYMFAVMLCVTVFLYALSSKKNGAFLFAMVFCAAAAWIRLVPRMLWLFLVCFWLLHGVSGIMLQSRAATMTARLRAKVPELLRPRFWGYPAAGIIIYFVLMSPILQVNYRHMGRVALGAGPGLSGWCGIMQCAKLENYENPEFRAFLDDFERWHAENPELYSDTDWRSTYATLAFLVNSRGLSEYVAIEWMGSILMDAVRHNMLAYVKTVFGNIPYLLLKYDPSTCFVYGADRVKEHYPWAIEATETINKEYMFPEWYGARFLNIQQHRSRLKPTYLFLCDLYNRFNKHPVGVLLKGCVLATGFIAGFYLFRRSHWLFVLGILAYHLILPLCMQPPIPRFRFPVYGLVTLVAAAGIRGPLLFVAGGFKKIMRSRPHAGSCTAV